MDILILGNGFDLTHDLKTTYMDFLNYCVEKNSKRLIGMINYGTTFIDNIWLRHFITTCNNYGKNWIDLFDYKADMPEYGHTYDSQVACIKAFTSNQLTSNILTVGQS